MCNEIRVLLSTKEEENKTLEEILKPLKCRMKISMRSCGQKLFSDSELPFIKTDEGDNIFGLQGAKEFVSQELNTVKAN